MGRTLTHFSKKSLLKTLIFVVLTKCIDESNLWSALFFYQQGELNNMSQHGKFATMIACMDGRAIPAIALYTKEHYHVDFTDTITEPGMDKWLLGVTPDGMTWLKRKLTISIINHGSRTIVVSGHDDCAGNPVSPETHRENIQACVQSLHAVVQDIASEHELKEPILIEGLWVSKDESGWRVQKVAS
jgi:carbonic anhydrase